MKLIRYNNPYVDPFNSLERLFEDSFFQSAGTPSRYRNENSRRLTISEDRENYYVQLDVPGYTKKDIQVDVENETLTISGKLEGKDDSQEESFQRKVNLGDQVESQKIKAKVSNGQLVVTLPRKAETQPRKITIA